MPAENHREQGVSDTTFHFRDTSNLRDGNHPYDLHNDQISVLVQDRRRFHNFPNDKNTKFYDLFYYLLLSKLVHLLNIFMGLHDQSYGVLRD